MPGFAVRNPYFVIVICLIISIVGGVTVARMPVDLFPPIPIPVVVVTTFYSGMPPEQVESSITTRYERFFTLAPNIDHIESRSLAGVSLIKVHFRPGTDGDAAVGAISNLAMANLRRLPPGTLPPVVMKLDASNQPVCLITLRGESLDETKLRDLGQYTIRNQMATVQGASIPQPFGGRLRQIMIYLDPLRLAAYNLSPMDVVRATNDSNVLLPGSALRMGSLNYNILMNTQTDLMDEINSIPLRVKSGATVYIRDIGSAKDAQAIQLNVVRVDGQRSAYLPVLKQGGDSNTIAIVDGVRNKLPQLVDIPDELETKVVFDQSEFVKLAVSNLLHEGAIGLFLTAVMILVFLGNMRATVAVMLSIPLSILMMFLVIAPFGLTINTMLLGGMALALSRLIDNSVVVLENIHRHLEMGEDPYRAAIQGGNEVSMAVLAATFTTSVVFFPVAFLAGVSKYVFSSLAIAVVVLMFASYVVAMTVVPLFCSRFLKAHSESHAPKGLMERFNARFNRGFDRFLNFYSALLLRVLKYPIFSVTVILGIFVASLALIPFVRLTFFPQSDSGKIVIYAKAPAGTRLEVSEEHMEKLEELIRRVIPRADIDTIVTNLGVNQDFSAQFTPNASEHTAFLQINMTKERSMTMYQAMDKIRQESARELPEVSTFFLSGGLSDAILNQGLPAPIDVQVMGSNLEKTSKIARDLAEKFRNIRGVNDVYIPQDVDYPALKLNVDRSKAALLGLTEREVVQNVITALSSNAMIAPSFWTDNKTGNDYYLTVQYPENHIRSLNDIRNMPLTSKSGYESSRLDSISSIERVASPTQITRSDFRRIINVFVSIDGEDLGSIGKEVEKVIGEIQPERGITVRMKGTILSMRESFFSFGTGMILALLLLYLIIVAQFRSFLDPLLILLAVPLGLTGVLITLSTTDTSLNIMSLMGLIMMTGIVVANSILIVDFAHRVRAEGMEIVSAVEQTCRIRLRPILMTSLATIIGLTPMALKLGEGSESYAPLARAIIGGLTLSLIFTVFVVPAGYLAMYRRGSK